MRVTRISDNTWQDEYDTEWEYFVDDMNGNIAVQSSDGAGIVNSAIGEVRVCKDGATFGVNCTDEFIVRHGEWQENDQ